MSLRQLSRNRLDAFRAALAAKPGWQQLREALIVIPIYAAAAFAIGFGTGFFTPGVLETDLHLYFVLPLSMVIFPSFLEEAVFRVLLLPRPFHPRGRRATILASLPSLFLYAAWHPLYASLSGLDIPVFDPPFLALVVVLGITCTWLYLRTGSLWLPTGVHWLTVVIWVFFLGGRNRLLTEMACP